MVQFYNTCGFFSNSQFGFREKLSTDNALICQITDIADSLEKKYKVAGLYIDIKKAFDTVDHNLLIKKLYNSGVKGKLLNWFIDYLSNRFQSVRVGNTISDYMKVKSGVPQGSTLGPILFLVYINDIFKLDLIGKTYSFADDTALLFSAVNEEILFRNINHDLKILSSWFTENKICPNSEKSYILCYYLNRSFTLNKNLILHKSSLCSFDCNCPPLLL